MATLFELARELAEAQASDVYLYNGEIKRESDLKFIECIQEHKTRENVILALTTRGGSPDAAYKMARYLQNNYKEVRVVISGMCKSAGTLIALGAHELIFSPYGELGPVDIQKRKVDSLVEQQSGLVTTEAIDALVSEAIKRHIQSFYEILYKTEGAISFETAARISADLTTGLFAPMFERIDPYDVGENARSIRIALDYGERLNKRYQNAKNDTIKTLVESYASHSFVIDYAESKLLFARARETNSMEAALVDKLGPLSRDQASLRNPFILCLSKPEETKDAGTNNSNASGSSRGDGATAKGAVEKGKRPAGSANRRANRKSAS